MRPCPSKEQGQEAEATTAVLGSLNTPGQEAPPLGPAQPQDFTAQERAV